MSPAKEAQPISALGHYEAGGTSELSAWAVAEQFPGSTDAGAEAWDWVLAINDEMCAEW